MEFKDGTHILTAEGKDIGSVERVVLDPKTKVITHLVVKLGMLFTEDKLIPVSFVDSSSKHAVILKRDIPKLSLLLRFEELHYVHTEPDLPRNNSFNGKMSPVYLYPPAGMSYWYYPGFAGYGSNPSIFDTPEIKRNIPDNSIALRENAKVYSADGKHIGDIVRVFVDPTTKCATHLVISHGMFFKECKLIPTSWITEAHDNEVKLTMRSDYLNTLPHYRD